MESEVACTKYNINWNILTMQACMLGMCFEGNEASQ